MRTEEQKRQAREQSRRWRANPENRKRMNERERLARSTGKRKAKHVSDTKAWWAAHPDYHKQWRDANAEQQREYGRLYAREYRAKHSEQVKAYKRAWMAEHRERILAGRRANYPLIADKHLSRTKEWRKKNASRVLDCNARRRANKLKVTTEDCTSRMGLLRLLPLCQYCFTLMDGTPTIDHVVPLIRGGQHSQNNLLASCQPCNSSKGDKLPSEWSGRLLQEEAA